MSAPEDDPAAMAGRLERLAAARIEAMLAEAEAHPQGVPSPERLRELGTLAALLRVSERWAPKPPPPRSARWPAAATLALATVTVGALLFLHVPHTEIELDATATEFGFTLARAQALTEPAVLRFVGIAGFAAITGPDAAAASHQRFAVAANPADAACTGAVTLDRLILPRGANVRIGRSALPRRVHLVVHAPGAILQLTLDGCVRAGGPTGTPAATQGVRSASVTLGQDDADMDLEISGDTGFALAPLVRASALSLSRVEEIEGDGVTLVRHVSTITGGTLLFDALDGQSRTLRTAEPIRFDVVDGELRSARLDGAQVALRFHGTVRGLASGGESHPRDWMPSWLDWLKANHAASLFWATATSGFALLTALLKWWRPVADKDKP